MPKNSAAAGNGCGVGCGSSVIPPNMASSYAARRRPAGTFAGRAVFRKLGSGQSFSWFGFDFQLIVDFAGARDCVGDFFNLLLFIVRLNRPAQRDYPAS